MSLIGVQGQINLSSNLGSHIFNLVLNNNFKNIVDIGTWNGLGTTYCVLKALEAKSDDNETKLYTIELYKEMFEDAKVNLADFLDENLIMLNGTIIKPEDIYWFDHSIINLDADMHARLWYHKDIENLKSADNVLNLLPEKIDLLILDGGEYTTYPEWQLLKDRTKYFILDDTNILKCSKIREEILSNSKCTVLLDEKNDRNGYLIGYFNE